MDIIETGTGDVAIRAKVKNLRKRWSVLESEAQEWRKDWRNLAKHFIPSRFRSLEDGDLTNKSGEKDTLYDNEGVLAMRVLAAGMQSGMTSPARPWFRLGVPDTGMEDDQEVKDWLFEVQQRLLTLFSRSNFYDSIHQVYAELGTFGTAVVYILEDDETVLRFVTLTAGEYRLITDAHGRTVGCMRSFDMTAEQLVARFGEDMVSEAVKTAYKDNSTKDKKFRVIHAVRPQLDKDPERLDAKGKAFESIYYEASASEDAPGYLEYGGFDEKPFAGPRWDVVGADTYGRGPGHDALNDVRMLQSMAKTMLKAVHKVVDPPMMAPPDVVNVSTVPGAINTVDHAMVGGMRPLYEVRPDLPGMAAAIMNVKAAIREALYNDLFKMMSLSAERTKTATEVMQLTEEKMMGLGPVVERLHSELLDVIIDRAFSVALRAGALPPPPQKLQGMELKVEYISLLAQAQKLIGTKALDQFMNMVAMHGQIFPEVLDIPNVDEIIDQYAEMLGVPPKALRSRDERGDRRTARDEAAAQAQRNEAVLQATQGAKNLAGSPVDTPNALSALTGGMMQ